MSEIFNAAKKAAAEEAARRAEQTSLEAREREERLAKEAERKRAHFELASRSVRELTSLLNPICYEFELQGWNVSISKKIEKIARNYELADNVVNESSYDGPESYTSFGVFGLQIVFSHDDHQICTTFVPVIEHKENDQNVIQILFNLQPNGRDVCEFEYYEGDLIYPKKYGVTSQQCVDVFKSYLVRRLAELELFN